MTEKEFKANIEAAQTRVRSFDGIDAFPDRKPETILAALEAGLRNPESGAAWDALVMLRDVVQQGSPENN